MLKVNALAIVAVLLSACASPGASGSGSVKARLDECSSAPHCVSSLANDADHRVEPFILRDASRWGRMIEAVRACERTTVIASDERYAHAEVISPWHFYTDDLELLRDGLRVDVRSSSRVGYYDFGVNRKRVEALRLKLEEAGIVAMH